MRARPNAQGERYPSEPFEVAEAAAELLAGMPAPVGQVVGEGFDAWVFLTTNANAVVRVASLRDKTSYDLEHAVEVEMLFFDEEFVETGGIVRGYGIAFLAVAATGDGWTLIDDPVNPPLDVDVDEGLWMVSWKERLPHLDPLGFLIGRYEGEALEALVIALQSSIGSAKSQRVLKRYPETRKLADAIDAGLPTGYLDIYQNLGVSAEGDIVAYDL